MSDFRTSFEEEIHREATRRLWCEVCERFVTGFWFWNGNYARNRHRRGCPAAKHRLKAAQSNAGREALRAERHRVGAVHTAPKGGDANYIATAVKKA